MTKMIEGTRPVTTKASKKSTRDRLTNNGGDLHSAKMMVVCAVTQGKENRVGAKTGGPFFYIVGLNKEK
jgi:hypothetical protein